jgi:RND family efflux transporter MFP subunit
LDVEALKIDRKLARTRTARRRRGPLGKIVALALAAALVWLFWSPLRGLVDRVRLPAVRVLQVVESHPAAAGAVRGTAANGHIVAARRAALSADTPGRIVELNVTEGSLVRKGDVVARLYADEYAAALQRAEAELVAGNATAERARAAVESAKSELAQSGRAHDAARAQVDEAAANEKLAQETFARTDDLVRRDIRSQADLDAAQASLEAARAQQRSATARAQEAAAAVDTAQQRVRITEGDLAVADANVEVLDAARALAAATLAKTEVRAPFDGIVVLKDAEVGEVVSPNSQGGSNARGSVCTMVDLASLEVQAEVPETNLASVQVGAPVTVFLDAWPDKAYACRVDRIWPTANRQKAIVEVRIAFDEPDDLLRPEMGVRAVFGAAPESGDAPRVDREPVILVPESAIVESTDGSAVFVLERDSVRLQQVQLGERRAGRAAVRAGLTAGQRIVLEPPFDLRSGDRVRLEEGS